MTRPELLECLTRLADQFSLRCVDKNRCFVGIHRGVLIDVSISEDWQVTLKFYSPTANVGDQILEQFASFTQCWGAGLPAGSVKGLMARDAQGRERVSDHACAVYLSARQWGAMSAEQLMRVPLLVSDDLRAHGGSEQQPCTSCLGHEATVAGVVDGAYCPMCEGCWQAVQSYADRGAIRTEQVVAWGPATWALLGVVAVGACGWGLLQEVEARFGRGMGTLLLLMASFFWGACVCDFVPRFSGGVTFALRVLIALAVLAGLLLGNVWGYFALLRRAGQSVTFSDAWDLYFSNQFGTPNEMPYLVSGCLGAWMGFWLLKSFGVVRVR